MPKNPVIPDSEDNSTPTIQDGTITDLEAAKLLLDSWKFRQAHAWSSLTRYFFAAVFVSVLPYILKNELVSKLKDFLLVLPIIGGLIALAAIWLYAAEYVRAQSMNRQFRSLLKNYQQYHKVDLRRIEKIVLAPRIGWTTVYLLTVASIVLSSINIFIVWSLIRITP
jgi:hypothetical protein